MTFLPTFYFFSLLFVDFLATFYNFNFLIHSHAQFSRLHFCFEPLAGLGDGGGGDPQQDGLLGYGDLQVREDIGADISLRQV